MYDFNDVVILTTLLQMDVVLVIENLFACTDRGGFLE